MNKYLIHVYDGKREIIYKGVQGETGGDALDHVIEKHLKYNDDVTINDIEATCVKMAQ